MQEIHPFHIVGTCINSDEILFQHMAHALTLGLPEIEKIEKPRGREALVIVGSGPSIAEEIGNIKWFYDGAVRTVAVRGAHDFLIAHDIVPDYALNVDPLETAAECFSKPHPDVEYLIASQSHPKMFENLKGFNVKLWHPYFKQGQTYPEGHLLIDGSTTSGLRAIRVFYFLGYRNFHLFGFDSCLSGEILRVNGDKPTGRIIDIRIEPEGEVFHCSEGMAQQAEVFQQFYDVMPDCEFIPYGHGLIQAMIRKRAENRAELKKVKLKPKNDRISFIHGGNDSMASYRYRAEIPARTMGAALNDMTASTLIFSKPQPTELMDMWTAKRQGKWIVADFCDDHFEWMHYKEFAAAAHVLTCPTEVMRQQLKDKFGRDAVVIPDPWEYAREVPHCEGATRVLWFGHHVNRESLQRVLPELPDYIDLHVVSNFGGAIPWSHETMIEQFRWADIVILPATDTYKSANRAIEAIRQGCYVVAEPHPALSEIPGIWLGNIKEGIEWTRQHPSLANERTSLAASFVTEKYSPKTVTAMWKTAIERPTTLEVVEPVGVAGST